MPQGTQFSGDPAHATQPQMLLLPAAATAAMGAPHHPALLRQGLRPILLLPSRVSHCRLCLWRHNSLYVSDILQGGLITFAIKHPNVMAKTKGEGNLALVNVR